MDKPNKEQIETAKKTIIRRTKRAQVYQALFETADGQWVLKDLMRKYNPLDHRPVENDRISTDFINGQRAVVGEILKTINTDVADQIAQLQKLPQPDPYE